MLSGDLELEEVIPAGLALGESGIGRGCLAEGRAWIEAGADELPGVQWHVENSGISGGGHVGSCAGRVMRRASRKQVSQDYFW